MKFRKTAVALAVAGVAAVPFTAQADTTLSGIIEIKMQGSDADGDAGDPTVLAGDIRAQVLADQELNSGLTGYGSIQFNLDDLTGQGGLAVLADMDEDGQISDDETFETSATVTADEVYVGLMGDFGDVRLGEIPLTIEYAQLANDIYDIGVQIPGGLSYTGAFGPVQLGLSFSPENNEDQIGAGLSFNLAGFTVGLGYEDRVDDVLAAVGAAYEIAGFSLSAHYWGLDVDAEDLIDIEDDPDGDGDDDDDGVNLDTNNLDADYTGLAVRAQYGISDVTLGVTYATVTQDVDDDPTESSLRFDVGYDMGGGLALNGRVQQTDVDAGFTPGATSDFGAGSVAAGDDLTFYYVMLAKSF